MTDPVPAASALVLHGDKILFVRTKRTPGLWAFPGGKVEKGETSEQAAIREIKEEVGLDIRLTERLGKYVTSSGFEIECFVALSDESDVMIDASEIIEAKWCGLQQGLALDLISTVRQALGNFAKRERRYCTG